MCRSHTRDDAVQDVSNFDTVFTTEAPMDSVVEGSQLSQTVQAQFAGALMKRLCRSLPVLLFIMLIHYRQGSPTMAGTCPSAPRVITPRRGDVLSRHLYSCIS